MPGRRVLWVEGRDDKQVVENICGKRGERDFTVESQDGVNNLLEAVSVQLKDYNEERDAVGVVVDANGSLRRRWQSVRDRFIKAGYQDKDLPKAHDSCRSILIPSDESRLPRAGVWIMPDNRAPGTLETFLFSLVPQSDVLLDYARKSIDSIPERRFSLVDKHKALLHTWLAWQEQPGRPYGTAISAGFLDSGVSQVDAFVNWLQRLFVVADAPTP